MRRQTIRKLAGPLTRDLARMANEAGSFERRLKHIVIKLNQVEREIKGLTANLEYFWNSNDEQLPEEQELQRKTPPS